MARVTFKLDSVIMYYYFGIFVSDPDTKYINLLIDVTIKKKLSVFFIRSSEK